MIKKLLTSNESRGILYSDKRLSKIQIVALNERREVGPMGCEDSEQLPGQTKSVCLCDSVFSRNLKAVVL